MRPFAAEEFSVNIISYGKLEISLFKTAFVSNFHIISKVKAL